MKIVFFCTFCGSPYAELLANPLKNKGVHVEIEEKSFHFIFIPKIIREGKPDILHIHNLHYFFLGINELHRFIKFIIFVIQILILKIIGTKVVWTVHEWADRFRNGSNDIPKGWSVIIGQIFDAIISHNTTTNNQIIKAFALGEEDKNFVIPHGNYICYKNTISQLDARKLLDISPDSPVFLLFGNIHRTKGFLEAIDAFKSLQKNQVYLLVVGYPAEEGIEEMIRDKIQGYENILFVSRRVENDEIQNYMNACDCVVLPHKVFTTSGTAILAMSFGKACIAPNDGYFRDVLDESGAFLFDSTQEYGLLHAMKLAIEKQDSLLDMGKHNFNLAEQCNWEYVAEETLNVYQKCLVI